MIEVQIPEMMEAGAHFGHQTKRWNPKMRPYIYGARSGVHIIDLQRTKELANDALKFIESVVASGKKVLFVGTKMQSRAVVREQAERAEMHYVNNRWMGGTLTNFNTIKKSIDRLIDFQTRRENNDFKGFTKRELLDVDRKIVKLEASLGGIKSLSKSPGAVFVIDPNHEKIAIKESKKLGIPIVALVDSNCDPDPIDYVIPANDDAISTIIYFTNKIADACVTGQKDFDVFAQQKAQKDATQKTAPKRSRVAKAPEPSSKKTAFIDRAVKEQVSQGEDTKEGYSAKVEVKTTNTAEEKDSAKDEKPADKTGADS